MTRLRLPAANVSAVDAFAVVAADFCSVIESHRALGRDGFLRAVHLALPRLYLAALQLPSTHVLFDDAESGPGSADGEPADPMPDPDALSTDEVSTLCHSLGGLIGERNFYAVTALHALYVLNASYEFNWPTQ